MTLKIPLTEYDNLMCISDLRYRSDHFKRVKELSEKIQDDDTVELDTIEMPTYIELGDYDD